MKRVGLLIVSGVLLSAPLASAQQSGQPSLAEVARQSEAARASTAKKASKTYTNQDLAAVPGMPHAEEAPAAPNDNQAAKPIAQEAVAEEPGQPVKPRSSEPEPPPERYWRGRAKEIRDNVDALKARLDKYIRQAANPDPDRERKRQADIAGMRQSMTQLQDQWAKLEQSARDAKVDITWITPAPRFVQ